MRLPYKELEKTGQTWAWVVAWMHRLEFWLIASFDSLKPE